MSNVTDLEKKGWSIGGVGNGVVALVKRSKEGVMLLAYVDDTTDEIYHLSEEPTDCSTAEEEVKRKNLDLFT
jgi:hypothetical protein